MPQICCAVNCSHTTVNCKLKRFPTDIERKQRWTSNLHRKGFVPKDWHRLCECHFDASQFEENREDQLRKLKPNSIPTIFRTHKLPNSCMVKVKTRLRVSDKPSTKCTMITETDGGMTSPITTVENNEKHRVCNCNEVLASVEQERDQLRKEVYRLKKELTSIKKEKGLLTGSLKMFRSDQLQAMERKAVCKWLPETLQEALQIRYACGITGYKFLSKLGWPYPS